MVKSQPMNVMWPRNTIQCNVGLDEDMKDLKGEFVIAQIVWMDWIR